jgi:hypothetical protein
MNDPNAPADVVKNTLLPDTSFKAVTIKLAKQFGLETVGAEFQQTTLADLVLHVPDDKRGSLETTAFHFFRSYNIVEFKSLSDKFNPLNFLDNVVRTCLFQQQKPEVPFSEVLNVHVIAFYPREFFKQMRKNKCYFRNDKKYKWLRWGNVAGHNVAIVIGRYLPVEKPYYQWLLFSQSTTEKLQEFAKMLYKEGENDLLEMLVRIKPKEVKTVVEEALQRDYYELAKALIDLMRTLGHSDGEITRDLGITPQRFLAKFTPMETLAKSTPEEILAMFAPEEILAALTPKEILAALPPEEILAALTPEEIVAKLPPNQLKELAALIAEKQQNGKPKE